MTGRRHAADAHAAPLPLSRLGDDVDPVTRPELVLVHDVVVVRMRPQDCGRRRAPALDGRDERAEIGAGVDEERRPALAVGDRVGVRQPVGLHAPLDQHGGNLTGNPDEENRWPA